jgi:hypothetical protein
MDLVRGFGFLVDFYCEKWIKKRRSWICKWVLKIMDQMGIRNWI